MTQKYIIHENCDLYTSHGNIQTYMIYDSFKKGLLGPDFKVAGFKPNGEETSNILDMQEIDAAVGVLIRVSEMRLQNHNTLPVYPGQKLMTPDRPELWMFKNFSP